MASGSNITRMITVNCSQCRAVLEMDDAFAGGVCRCQYCGTIQSVPAKARRVAPGGSGAQAGATPAAQGLDALADVVASSGPGRGALRSASQPAPPLAPARAALPVDYGRPPTKSLGVPLIIALAVIVLLLGMVGMLLLGTTTVVPVVTSGPSALPVMPPIAAPNSSNVVSNENPPAGEGETVAAPVGPHFCGIKLDGVPSVVYVLDRGQATAELFDTLKEATYRSVESLKPGTKFQIIFWDNADAPAAYPADKMVDATAHEVEAARAQFADLIAGGRARADGAIRRAATHKPAAIVLVTGKAFDLDSDLVKTVQSAARAANTKVHTVALRGDDQNPVLKIIAEKTHGEFRVVTAKELRDYSY